MRRVFAPKWWGLHIAVVLAVLVMLRLGLWQWHRANSSCGGIQNYAYAFQWPIFACFALFLWVRTLQEEVRRPAEGRRTASVADMPEAEIIRQPGLRVGIRTAPIEVDAADVELVQWNARFAALNAADAAVERK
jgi:hypothetical protein